MLLRRPSGVAQRGTWLCRVGVADRRRDVSLTAPVRGFVDEPKPALLGPGDAARLGRSGPEASAATRGGPLALRPTGCRMSPGLADRAALELPNPRGVAEAAAGRQPVRRPTGRAAMESGCTPGRGAGEAERGVRRGPALLGRWDARDREVVVSPGLADRAGRSPRELLLLRNCSLGAGDAPHLRGVAPLVRGDPAFRGAALRSAGALNCAAGAAPAASFCFSVDICSSLADNCCNKHRSNYIYTVVKVRTRLKSTGTHIAQRL